MVLRWMVLPLLAAGPVAAAEFPVHVALGCEGAELALTLQGEGGTLYVSGAEMPMARARSASGVKFDSIDDPETHIWTKGDEAMVRIAGQDLQGCRVERVSRVTDAPWQIVSFDGQTLAAEPGEGPQLTFDEDGTLRGQGGCGALEGSWSRAEGVALRLEADVAHDDACTPEGAAQDDALLAALSAITDLGFASDGTLELRADDAVRLTATQ